MNLYELPHDAGGYRAGDVLIDVSVQQARALECNRCGDCCSAMRAGVSRDEDTGMPRFLWGQSFPADRYTARYGEPMLLPVVRGDGGPVVKPDADFEVLDDGRVYTAFKCSHLVEHDQDPSWPHRGEDEPAPGGDPRTSCGLIERFGRDPDPDDLSQHRPRNCGEFPVFGADVDATLIDGHPFVPPTGALPRCTWHGVRVVGPWRTEPYWVQRWEKQQRGEPVEELGRIDADTLEAFKRQLLSRRATVDGSAPREQ